MLEIKTIFIKKVEHYDNIAIFFHEIPDLDALGSAYGLKFFLKTKYPQKNVQIIGLDILSSQFQNNIFYFDRNHVPNDFLINSLGIILDTANAKRVWSQRYNFCRELFRIDHHPKTEIIADYEWVDETYAATSEMVGELLFEWDKDAVLIPTCNYLYAGIITDTNRFLYKSVSPKTYEIASKLLINGCNREKVHDAIYLREIDELKFRGYVLKKAHFDENLGFIWAKLGKNSFRHYGVKLRMSMVHVFGNVKNIKIWFTVYYDDVLRLWKGSIRSAYLPINQIAEKYHGGGHKLAAGVTIYKKKEIYQLVRDIKNYLKQNTIRNKEENGR